MFYTWERSWVVRETGLWDDEANRKTVGNSEISWREAD